MKNRSRMRSNCIACLMLLFTLRVYSQGQVIDRKTKSGKEFSVTILKVGNDSLTYKYFGKTKTVAMSSVIAYRKDYRSGPFIFPDPHDKEKYLIVNNDAIEKKDIHPSLSEGEKDDYTLKLLKPYEVPLDSFQKKTLNHKITLRSMDGSKTVKANPKKRVYIAMKNDPLRTELRGKIFKITNDSILYIAYKLNKKRTFFAVHKNDIKYMGLESVKAYRTRTAIGIVGCVILSPPPLIIIPIYILNHPKLEPYDLEDEWHLTLTDEKK